MDNPPELDLQLSEDVDVTKSAFPLEIVQSQDINATKGRYHDLNYGGEGGDEQYKSMAAGVHRFNHQEDDDDLLEFEEMKDQVKDLQQKLLERQKKKKSNPALSVASKSSLLSKKDFDEIRSIARHGSGEIIVPTDEASSQKSRLTLVSETSYRSQLTKYSDSTSLYTESKSKTSAMVNLEEQLLNERQRRLNLEKEVESLKKLSQDLVSKMTTTQFSGSGKVSAPLTPMTSSYFKSAKPENLPPAGVPTQ